MLPFRIGAARLLRLSVAHNGSAQRSPNTPMRLAQIEQNTKPTNAHRSAWIAPRSQTLLRLNSDHTRTGNKHTGEQTPCIIHPSLAGLPPRSAYLQG